MRQALNSVKTLSKETKNNKIGWVFPFPERCYYEFWVWIRASFRQESWAEQTSFRCLVLARPRMTSGLGKLINEAATRGARWGQLRVSRRSATGNRGKLRGQHPGVSRSRGLTPDQLHFLASYALSKRLSGLLLEARLRVLGLVL